MKNPIRVFCISLLVSISLGLANCTVPDNNGIEVEYVKFCDTEMVIDDTVFRGGGYLDTYANELDQLESGYQAHIQIAMRLPNNSNETYSQTSGNDLQILGFEFEYNLPEGFDPIPKRFESRSMLMDGGSGELVKGFLFAKILGMEEVAMLNDSYEKYSYGSLHDAFSTTPPGGNQCTPRTAEADCNGYACLNPETGDPLDVADDIGICASTCSLKSGCARYVDEAGVVYHSMHSKNPYRCDISISDTGICRQSCTTGFSGECKPLTEGVNFECIDSFCAPVSDTGLDPRVFTKIIVKIKVKAQRKNGDIIWSKPYPFPIDICRGCMMDFSRTSCASTPFTDDAAFALYEKYLESTDNPCGHHTQDFIANCAYIWNCFVWFCDGATDEE